MAKKKKNDIDIENEVITTVKTEVSTWENSIAQVTEKIGFDMRALIRQCRKNYWGVFDVQIDPITGRKKIWLPLTESTVESDVKNADLDTKDINFRAKKEHSFGITKLVRAAVKNNLSEIFFGQYIDEMIRTTAIDGTGVWKIMEKKEDGKYLADIRNVDLLNFYIDPLAKSIQEASAIIERAVLPINEIKSYDGWINTKDLQGDKNVHPTESQFKGQDRGNTKYLEVYERWGLMPKSYITGNKKDEDQIEGHIVCSKDGNVWRVHLIEENKKGIKPYEEFWRKRVPGRWYGKGVAESIIMLQLWLNIIVNLRINRNYIESLGLFKARKGKGITAQMMSKLVSSGVIMVDDLNDIEPMVMSAASAQSYKDEETVRSWAERVTQVFEAITGEQMPASTTATVGAIQSRSAMSAYTLIKEGYGMALQRVLKRHILPIIQKNLTKGEIIRLTDKPEDLRELDDLIANYLVYEEMEKTGGINEDNYTQIMADVKNGLNKMGDSRYFKLKDKIDLTDYDVEVYVTNEEFDQSVMVQNLINMLNVVPEFKEQITTQVFDLMGLNFRPNITPPVGQTEEQPMPEPQKSGGVSSMVDQLSRANIPMNNYGR